MKITEILSVYAALLSTIVFAWNIRKAIPSYKVEVVFGTDKVDDEYVSGAYISVKNPSAHTVHLSNISILYPFGKTGIFEKIKHVFKYRRLPLTVGWCHSSLSNYGINDKCPVALEPGKSIGILVPEDILEKIFEDNKERAIKASVQDELWRNKYSRKFEYPRTGKGKT
ncbi:hypothetical protein [Thauera sp. Sel9]|uniref:hypothetical protein n=1 Tax=Thauera sp. Sel9 TaxID=2974299 RepID=UPI0021E138A5|nr:hypothetical protein [Thauera sp. Sel9]MCV2219931.1 hypothetical protein [Thauera sp. Sel9]